MASGTELFPDRVRALVLDGAVKPTDDLSELGAGQGAGLEGGPVGVDRALVLVVHQHDRLEGHSVRPICWRSSVAQSIYVTFDPIVAD